MRGISEAKWGRQDTNEKRFRVKLEDLDLITGVLRELRMASLRGAAVVVEGEDDADALNRIGIANLFLVSTEGIRRMCEELEGKEEVIILTDFDSEGEEINERISEGLTSFGVRVNRELRERFKKAFLPYSRTVEGLKDVFEYLSFSGLIFREFGVISEVKGDERD